MFVQQNKKRPSFKTIEFHLIIKQERVTDGVFNKLIFYVKIKLLIKEFQ